MMYGYDKCNALAAPGAMSVFHWSVSSRALGRAWLIPDLTGKITSELFPKLLEFSIAVVYYGCRSLQRDNSADPHIFILHLTPKPLPASELAKMSAFLRSELVDQCKRTNLKGHKESKHKHKTWPADLVRIVSLDLNELSRGLQMLRATIPPFPRIDASPIDKKIF